MSGHPLDPAVPGASIATACTNSDVMRMRLTRGARAARNAARSVMGRAMTQARTVVSARAITGASRRETFRGTCARPGAARTAKRPMLKTPKRLSDETSIKRFSVC